MNNPIGEKLTNNLECKDDSIEGIHELISSLLNEKNLSANELVENVQDFFISRLNRLADLYNH